MKSMKYRLFIDEMQQTENAYLKDFKKTHFIYSKDKNSTDSGLDQLYIDYMRRVEVGSQKCAERDDVSREAFDSRFNSEFSKAKQDNINLHYSQAPIFFYLPQLAGRPW